MDSRPLPLLVVSPTRDDLEYFCLAFAAPAWRLPWSLTVQESAALLEARPVGAVLAAEELADGSWSDVVEVAGRLPASPPVIVLSRRADDGLWMEVLAGGGFDVLSKPFDFAEVRRVVELALRRSASVEKSSSSRKTFAVA